MDKLNPISEKIIGAAYNVSNSLGIGFLEKVFENALAHELEISGVSVKQQNPIQITYKGKIVGDYLADLLVEDSILVELKAVKTLDDIHIAQCMNYLKATGLKLCLLINFGTKRIQIKRIVN